MARPINADAQATRQRILMSAQARFADHGHVGASVRSIAADAQVSVAMVNHYFGSKARLHEACIEACIEGMYAELAPLRDRLMAAASLGGAPSLHIAEAARQGFRFAREHRTSSRLLQRQVIEAGTLDPQRRAEVQAPFLAAVTAWLAGATGRSPQALRMPVQSAVLLVARYAIATDDELRFFAGLPPDADPLPAVEQHLVDASLALLSLPGVHA